LGRRPDGVAINKALQIVYILEFKRSIDKDHGFPEVKEAEANEQHKSIGALRAAAPKWEFEQIHFVVSNHGSACKSDFNAKLKKLDDCTRRKERQNFRRLCYTGMRSARSRDLVLSPASSRTCEANY